MMNGGVVAFGSTKQKGVSKSTPEAEYMGRIYRDERRCQESPLGEDIHMVGSGEGSHLG